MRALDGAILAHDGDLRIDGPLDFFSVGGLEPGVAIGKVKHRVHLGGREWLSLACKRKPEFSARWIVVRTARLYSDACVV